jgi:thiamine kinase-like enzyme
MKRLNLRPFKADWEKTNVRIEIPDGLICKMVKLVLPGEQLKSYRVVEGGCANLNIKLDLASGCKKILRIYVRDHDAAYREQAISNMIYRDIPVPLIEYVGKFEGYQFAISEFKLGITLRDLFLNDQACNIEDIMHQVGELLSRLTQFTFSTSGLFDRKLNVAHLTDDHECVEFAKNCLQNEVSTTTLSPELIATIDQRLDQYTNLLEQMTGNQLVHADFDPANILVTQNNNRWQVNAILDWEFAFSGSMLWDIANMLRYAHMMPEQFENSFIHSLTSSGVNLPNNWRVIIQLLNMVSLLDCLNRTNIENTPLQCADIGCLLKQIVQSIDET